MARIEITTENGETGKKKEYDRLTYQWTIPVTIGTIVLVIFGIIELCKEKPHEKGPTNTHSPMQVQGGSDNVQQQQIGEGGQQQNGANSGQQSGSNNTQQAGSHNTINVYNPPVTVADITQDAAEHKEKLQSAAKSATTLPANQ